VTNTLLIYYLFLVAGAVLLAALRKSPLISQKGELYVTYLLTSPFALVVLLLNLTPPLTLVLTLGLSLGANHLIRIVAPRHPTRTATILGLILWGAEILLPLSLHFAFGSHRDLERPLLLIAGLIVIAATLSTFYFYGSHPHKKHS
jgi:CBS-domain-containing membrane protein